MSDLPIYVVRHGESMDGIDLTELGLRQAEQARDSLIAEQLGSTTLLLSSPMSRALQTANIIGSGLGTEARLVEELGSMDYIKHLPKGHDDSFKKLDAYVRNYVDRERATTGLSEGPVVMVGHELFISTFVRLRGRDFENGEVVRHELTTNKGRSLFGIQKRHK